MPDPIRHPYCQAIAPSNHPANITQHFKHSASTIISKERQSTLFAQHMISRNTLRVRLYQIFGLTLSEDQSFYWSQYSTSSIISNPWKGGLSGLSRNEQSQYSTSSIISNRDEKWVTLEKGREGKSQYSTSSIISNQEPSGGHERNPRRVAILYEFDYIKSWEHFPVHRSF